MSIDNRVSSFRESLILGMHSLWICESYDFPAIGWLNQEGDPTIKRAGIRHYFVKK
ncbi:MAG: hypothetical protein GDA56_03530 [Hormoscilla sp. GM7CHS1pb]|nr:hypothetical protein [Hormoscilla sp. GM7CHS1pb]